MIPYRPRTVLCIRLVVRVYNEWFTKIVSTCVACYYIRRSGLLSSKTVRFLSFLHLFFDFHNTYTYEYFAIRHLFTFDCKKFVEDSLSPGFYSLKFHLIFTLGSNLFGEDSASTRRRIRVEAWGGVGKDADWRVHKTVSTGGGNYSHLRWKLF